MADSLSQQAINSLPKDTGAISPDAPTGIDALPSVADAEKNSLKQSMFYADQTQPDREAKVLALSKRLKMPTSYIHNNYEELSKHANAEGFDYDKALIETPALSSWAQNPSNAAIGKDDWENLSVLDKSASQLSNQKKNPVLGEMWRVSQLGATSLERNAVYIGVAKGQIPVYNAAERLYDIDQREAQLRQNEPDYVTRFNEPGGPFAKNIQMFLDEFHREAPSIENEKIRSLLQNYAVPGVASMWDIASTVARYSNVRGLASANVENYVATLPSQLGGAALGGLAAYMGRNNLAAALPMIRAAYAVGGAIGEWPIEYAGSYHDDVSKLNPQSVEDYARILGNQDFMRKLDARAEGKASGTTGVDFFVNLLIGKYLEGAEGKGIGAKVFAGIKDTAVQMLGGSGSEAVGEFQRAVSGEVSDVLADAQKTGVLKIPDVTPVLGRAIRELDPGQLIDEGGFEILGGLTETIGAAVSRKGANIQAGKGRTSGASADAQNPQITPPSTQETAPPKRQYTAEERKQAAEIRRYAYPHDPAEAAKTLVAHAETALETLTDAKAISETVRAIQASPVTERSAEAMKALVYQASNGESYLNYQIDDFDEYAQSKGMTGQQLANEVLGPGGSEEYQSVKQAGPTAQLEVPVHEFSVNLAKSEHLGPLLEIASTQEDGPKVAEAQELIRQLPQIMESLAQEAKGTPETPAQQEQNLNTATIKKQVEDSIVAAGRPRAEAKAAAKIFVARLEKRAKAFDINPLSLAQGIPGVVGPEAAQVLGPDGKVQTQAGPQSPRGFYSPSANVIALLRTANFSTFIHEMSHAWLEEIQHDVALIKKHGPQNLAQKALLEDADKILEYLGAESFETLTEDQKETWARSFEKYVAEGKAPSKDLQSAFNRFKIWLRYTYKDLRKLRVELTPEVRRVMDRLLVSDEILEKSQRGMYSMPMFPSALQTDAELTGLSKKTLEQYRKVIVAHDAAQSEDLDKKMWADLKREQSAERAQIKKNVTQEINQAPGYRALSLLKDGVLPDGTELPEGVRRFKLDKYVLERDYGKVQVKANMPEGVYSESGDRLNPDVAAPMLGFNSGKELVDTLMNLPDKESAIEAVVDQRMRILYGDMLTDGTLSDSVIDAYHNEYGSEKIRLEMQMLQEMAPAVAKEVTRKVAERPKIIPKASVIRQEAERRIGMENISKLRPGKYALNEKRAAKQALEAYLKGDVETAFRYKQYEYLNHYLYLEAKKAYETRQKALAEFKAYTGSDKEMSKTRSIDFVHAARGILAAFGIGNAEKVDEALDKIRRYDKDQYENLKSIIDPVLANAKPYEDLTYEDFLALRDAAAAVWELSKYEKEFTANGIAMQVEDAAAPLATQINALTPEDKRKISQTPSRSDNAKVYLMAINNARRIVESWADAMDLGAPLGRFKEYITTKMNQATTAYRLATKEAMIDFKKIMDDWAPTFTWDPIEAPELTEKGGKIRVFRNKQELLAALLHRGNMSNLQKLLRGYGWGEFMEDGKTLNTARWDAFERRMQEKGILTKRDYDNAQRIWDLFDKLKPAAQIAHKKVYGRYFDEVTAHPFKNKFGEYRGGYVPAKVDSDVVLEGDVHDELALQEKANLFMFPSTPAGMTKSRVEAYAAPLKLSLGIIPAQLAAVSKFAHLAVATKEIGRLFKNETFKEALRAYDPTAETDLLIPWLDRASTQRISQPTGSGKGWQIFDKFMRAVRKNSAMNIMMFSIPNAVQQLTGLSLSSLKIKNKRFLVQAFWEAFHAPKESAEQIAGLSKYMRTVDDDQIRDVYNEIEDMVLNPNKFQKGQAALEKHAYILSRLAQNFVNNVTWKAAYNDALEQGLHPDKAVLHADSVVRLTQGSYAPEAIARTSGGNAFMRLFNMFSGYFNMQGNLLQTEFQNTMRTMGLRKGAGRLLYIHTFGFMIPAFISLEIMNLFTGGIDDDDDGEYLDDLIQDFFGAQFRSATALIPGAGPFANAAADKAAPYVNKALGTHFKAYGGKLSISPAVNAFDGTLNLSADVFKEMFSDKTRKKYLIRDALTAIGLTGVVPGAGAAGKPLGYISDVDQGYVRKPKNPVELTQGLISGRGKK